MAQNSRDRRISLARQQQSLEHTCGELSKKTPRRIPTELPKMEHELIVIVERRLSKVFHLVIGLLTI